MTAGELFQFWALGALLTWLRVCDDLERASTFEVWGAAAAAVVFWPITWAWLLVEATRYAFGFRR